MLPSICSPFSSLSFDNTGGANSFSTKQHYVLLFDFVLGSHTLLAKELQFSRIQHQ